MRNPRRLQRQRRAPGREESDKNEGTRVKFHIQWLVGGEAGSLETALPNLIDVLRVVISR
jgi:hypothetical protein